MADQGEIIDYLLDELDELDRVRFERSLQEDAGLREEVDRMRPVLARLDGLSDEAWDHVSAHHGAEGRPARQSAPRRRLFRLAPRRAAFAFAGVAAVAVIAIALLTAGSSRAPSHTVVLSALAGAPPGSRATATITGSRRVQMNIQHLRPTDAGHYYELWLMTNTTHLVSVGSFRVGQSGSARLSMPLPAPAGDYRYLNVSVQQAGAGSAISNLSVLRGPTASA